MKLIATSFCVAALFSAGLIAQESEIHSKTKVSVHNGKKITVSGCLQQGADGLVLTDVSGGAAHSYVLIGKGDDLAKQVGHRVEITGKAADRDKGKVVVKDKSKMDDQKEHESHMKAEGDLDMPLLGVEKVKTLAKGCS